MTVEPMAVLCFGDSNTWGLNADTGRRMSRNDRWPGVLSATLGSGFHVIEEGLRDRTTAWNDPITGDTNGVEHIQVCLAAHQPLDLVVLMVGTSDLRARLALSATAMLDGVEMLAGKVLASEPWPGAGSPQLLLVPPPITSEVASGSDEFGGSRPKSLAFVGKLEELAVWLGCGFVSSPDIDDGPYLGVDGHRRLAMTLAPVVRGCFLTGDSR